MWLGGSYHKRGGLVVGGSGRELGCGAGEGEGDMGGTEGPGGRPSEVIGRA